MENNKYADFWKRIFTVSLRMAAAALTVVGLLLAITYNFNEINELTDAFKWMNFAHVGLAATIFFLISSFLGVIQEIPQIGTKWKNRFGFLMLFLLIIGLIFLFYLLTTLFINTF